MHEIKLIGFLIILIISSNHNVYAQSERFLGGGGDGSSQTISTFNFNSISYSGNDLTAEINLADNQEDTTLNTIINFAVTFSEAIIEFNSDDVIVSGSALAQSVEISGEDLLYNIAVSGMQNNGSVVIDILQGKVQNSVGNPNQAPTNIDNDVFYFGADLTVEITRSAGQAYKTNESIIYFNAIFSEDVSDFDNSDIQLGGDALPGTTAISGSGKNYVIAVSGMQTDGEIIITIPAGSAHDVYNKPNIESVNTENTVMYDITKPGVEIMLSDGQSNPAYELPLKFKVKFSEEVSNFTSESVSFGGSAGLTIAVSGNGSEYSVSMYGANTNETVTIYINEGIVYDFVGNTNTSSVNTDNSIKFIGTTGIADISNQSNAKIYYSFGNIVISFNEIPKEKVQVDVYNLRGQHILKKELSDKLNYTPINRSSAYFIRLTGNGYMHFAKIFAQ